LDKGLTEIKKFINNENGEIREKYTYTAILVALNDHAIQVQRALEEVKGECSILIQSCLNAKQGIMQPQVLSPSHLIDILKSSQNSFPRDLQVPVTLSEVYLYQLVNIVTYRPTARQLSQHKRGQQYWRSVFFVSARGPLLHMQHTRSLRVRGDVTTVGRRDHVTRVFCDACPCRVYVSEQNSEAGGVQ
jgi:hypothetical protein